MTFSHTWARRRYKSIITIGEGIDDLAATVLKDEPVSIIAQTVAYGAIKEDYGASEVREVGIKISGGCNYGKAIRGQCQRGD